MDLPSPLPRRLNLGCGWDHREGYLNVDCYERHQPDLIADISNLPMLPSGYFEEVLAKDVLEHFERTRTDTILAEWARLLSPDGHLERFPVWLNRDSHGRRNSGVFGQRFGFERVPWPDPIRRTCASAL
jgi:Methyltransferase domain